MAEVILRYDTQLRGRDDRRFVAQACGHERTDGMWEGWLEFLPLNGSEPVLTGRETTQPNRDDLAYWATGLTDPYLDGALLRALTDNEFDAPVAQWFPVSDGPEAQAPAAVFGGPARAVLDPFRVYAQGDEILRGQLRALSATQLRNIVAAYNLSELGPGELERLSKAELVAFIMAAVERGAVR